MGVMTLETNATRWELEVASVVDLTRPPETDELRVEMRLDGEEFGFVREAPTGIEIIIYSRDDGRPWSVQLPELLTVLDRAKRKLGG